MLNNLPQDNDNRVSFLNASRIKAFGFTLPTGNDYRLDDVILRLRGYDNGETFTVQIRNDTGGNDPGSTTLVGFDNPTGQGAGDINYTFIPSAPFTFTSGNKYWLFVQGSDDTLGWSASDPGISPTGIATFTNNRFSNPGGSSYTDSTIINSFQINATEATPVPLDSDAMPIVGSALFMAGGLWWKKKRAQAKVAEFVAKK